MSRLEIEMVAVLALAELCTIWTFADASARDD